MTEVSNAYGEGYNATRSPGAGGRDRRIRRRTGGGDAEPEPDHRENDAFRENLAEQYTREAPVRGAAGGETTCSARRREQLREMRTAFSRADARYRPRETGRRRWRWRS